VDSEDVSDFDEGQTYDDFVRMGKVGEPNEDGTGRFVPTDKRKTIGVMALGKVNLKKLKMLLGEYFRPLKVEVVSHTLKMVKGGMQDTGEGVEFPITVKKGKFEVFEMFNVFEEYLPKAAFSLLVITPKPIYEFETGPANNLLGRATGD
jgi:hypothetical protein